MTIRLSLIFVFLGIFASSMAAADSFRCGSSIIQVGMAASEVAKKCGAPKSKETRTVPILARNAGGGTRQVGETTVEVWRYRRGNVSFPAELTIEEGKVKKVELITD